MKFARVTLKSQTTHRENMKGTEENKMRHRQVSLWCEHIAGIWFDRSGTRDG